MPVTVAHGRGLCLLLTPRPRGQTARLLMFKHWLALALYLRHSVHGSFAGIVQTVLVPSEYCAQYGLP